MRVCITNKKLLDFSKSVIDIRFWEEKNLPLSQSRIAFDLFLLIAKCHYSDIDLTQKYLFNSLGYSERGVRYVLEQFVDNGWCDIVGSTLDRRFRHVVASKKLTSAFEAYERTFTASFAKLVIQRASDLAPSNDNAFSGDFR